MEDLLIPGCSLRKEVDHITSFERDGSLSPGEFLGFTPEEATKIKRSVANGYEANMGNFDIEMKSQTKNSILGCGRKLKKQELADNIEANKKPSVKNGKDIRDTMKTTEAGHNNLSSGTLKRVPSKPFRKLVNKAKRASFECDRCGNIYKYLRGMRQHQKLACNVEPQFPCPYCPKRYRYRHSVRDHVRKCHNPAFPKWYVTHYIMPVLVQEKIT